MESTLITVDQFEAREADGHRELDCIAVPYLKITHKVAGRPERFMPTSLAVAARDASGRIRLRSHGHSLKEHLPVGVTTAMEDRPEGFWTRFRLYDTPEGRAAYEQVREGVYGGVSVGFIAVKERVVDGVREVLEARLHHVSLVEEPAYDDAQILAVRSASEYEWMRHVPEVGFSDVDDTPMSVRVRQMLGNVRPRS